ncbi:hypothetical protein FRX31_003777 [Thalictrum thalictroides]|uniref:Uncharacterized protein n=1 Tax=Thalictrum thalictroides TaxID=46969 RepID=A0A7J6XCC9_THATH|nr:hypothetical protein FRX31_003777 [Thalictrum thalictroides]
MAYNYLIYVVIDAFEVCEELFECTINEDCMENGLFHITTFENIANDLWNDFRVGINGQQDG